MFNQTFRKQICKSYTYWYKFQIRNEKIEMNINYLNNTALFKWFIKYFIIYLVKN